SRFHDCVEILTSPCRGLVEAIEAVEAGPEPVRELLQAIIQPMLERGADTLVLGCTHYSLVRDIVAEATGPGVAIIEASDAVAREVQRRLTEAGVLHEGADTGRVEFLSSGDVAQQERVLGHYWHSPLKVTALPSG